MIKNMDIYAGILKDDYDTKFYPYLKALKKGKTKHTCFVELFALSIHYQRAIWIYSQDWTVEDKVDWENIPLEVK